jgi:hypothetical protein
MRKSKFTDSQIMDAVKRVEAGFGGLIFAEKWASALPPFTNGEPNMAVWTFQ